MKRAPLQPFFRWLAGSMTLFLLCLLTDVQASHHHAPPPPPPPVIAIPHGQTPVIVKPPVPIPVIPPQPVTPPPSVQKTGPTPEQAAQISRSEKLISSFEQDIQMRTKEIAAWDEEIAYKEGVIAVLDERIAVFSKEKEQLLAERIDIRQSLVHFRTELTDNELFMKAGINIRTAAPLGNPVNLQMIDYWINNVNYSTKNIPGYMEYLKREKIDPLQAKYQALLEWANNQPASQRENQIEWVKRSYEPQLAAYEKSMQENRDKLSNLLEVKDRLMAMRPTIENADDRIRQIELRAVELDKLIQEDVADRRSVTGLDQARKNKEMLEKSLAWNIETKNNSEAYLKAYKEGIKKEGEAFAKGEPVIEPQPIEEAPAVEPELKPVEPAPVVAETIAAEVDLTDQQAQLQQDVEYHLRNRDRAEAELRSIQQRNGTEKQQADLKARIAASEEFALAAGRELTRIGGSISTFVKEDLSDYDPYKITQTDLNLMDLSARARAEQDATEQVIKTRNFIRGTTDQADAIDLIEKLERIAGFNNQGGLQDFERLDAVRQFRSTVFETRTQANFAQQSLEATLADLDNTAYEIGAYRVQVGATLAVGLGTGGIGMTAMAGKAGLLTLASGTAATLTTQAAAASKVLLVYNLATGSITGYADKGIKGAVEGVGKETLPINTYIAIRDGKGGGTIAVGLLQDAGNLLQIYGLANSMKTAIQAKTVANAESGLKGSQAALNRDWKLEQLHIDFLSTQTNAQATVLNTTLTENSDRKTVVSTPPANTSSRSSAPAAPTTPTATGSANIKPSGNPGKITASVMDAGSLITGEAQAKAVELIKDFDAKIQTGAGINTPGLQNKDLAALGGGTTFDRQVEIIRGMSEGQYSAIVADALLLQETGKSLVESMALVSETIDSVQKKP